MFEAGDKVVRLPEYCGGRFVEGKVYTVSDIDSDGDPLFNEFPGQFFISCKFKLAEPQFKRGDKVLVRDHDHCNWVERTYLATIEGAKYPHYCVASDDKDAFCNEETFCATEWKQLKPIPETKVVTHEEALEMLKEKFGSDVTIEIKEK
jgi:hypothetical protein